MSHLKSKLNNTKIIMLYYLIILILTSYATYKNGIIIYQRNLINFINIFKPLLLVLISIIIPYLINFIYYKEIKKDNYNFKEDYTSIFMALITLTLPLNINIFLYLFIIIIFSILKLFYKIEYFNYYNLIKLLIILVLFIIGKYSYLTIYDLNIETNLSTLDLFLGRGIGGLATTNILLLFICYLIMLLNNSYKKEIPVISIVSYFIILILFDIVFKNNVILDIKNLISSEFIFACIFIATISFYSPIKSKEKIIYSIILGILSFIFNKIFNIYDGVFIALLITNLIIIGYEKLERIIINEHK